MKATPEVVSIARQHTILAGECAYSAMTRMALLGYHGITLAEERLITRSLPGLLQRLFHTHGVGVATGCG
jgi:hypothetical protein